jgi:V8-like Glu-specific endopeptidase
MTVTPVRAEQTEIKVPNLSQGEVVEAKTYPWSAIGKLNNGVGGSCTAVLVSQNYALTAAHCLFFRNTGRYLPAQSFHLIFGYENQQFRDHLRVSAYYVPPTYEPTRPYETLASDWALLSISGEPTTRPLDVSQFHGTTESHLMTAGYSHQTPYAMTADRRCRFVGRSHDESFLFDSCQAPAGFSGAPVIVSNADKRSYSIAGIHVANQVWQAQAIAIAIPIEAIWREIKPCVNDHKCQFQFVATGTDPTAAEVLAGLPNLGNQNRFELTSSPLCAANDPRCKTTLSGP